MEIIEYVVCYVLSTPSGSHPTVTRFPKRVFDSKPTAPGYTRPWDANEVLCYLGTIYKSEDLSLWDLTLKTVMVVSAQRDLYYLLLFRNLDDIISSETLITFILSKPFKQSKPRVS